MEFPDWVTEPTVCATRTFKLVLPSGTNHRATVLVKSFPQRPIETVRHDKSGRLSVRWADVPLEAGFTRVPVTEEN